MYTYQESIAQFKETWNSKKSLFHRLSFCQLRRSLIKDIEARDKDPSKPYPSEESPLMSELSAYLESAGIHDPLKKVK